MTLSLVDSHPAAAEDRAVNHQPQPSTTRVLVIEDVDPVRDLIVQILSGDGCRVAEASSANEARSELAKDTPDVVVLDLGLPDSTGLDLLRKLVSVGLPVVVLTGRGEEVDRVQGLELGADEYMVKPFYPKELAIRVRRASARARLNIPTGLQSGGLRIKPRLPPASLLGLTTRIRRSAGTLSEDVQPRRLTLGAPGAVALDPRSPRESSKR